MKQRIENIVFYELRRRGYQVFNGISSLYSVDFIAICKRREIYISILSNVSCYADHLKVIKDLSVLPRRECKRYFISLDHRDYSTEEVRHLHLADFLLTSVL